MLKLYSKVLRLFPPAVFNTRVANQHCTLPKGGGVSGHSPIFLRKGDIVVFSSWASHRLGKQFGEHPEEFHPERWENLRGEIPGYIPFSSGPRVCPGRKLLFQLL
jgi:cytochrome P450